MITGITSTFLTAKKAKSGKKIAVLEIDEASLPKSLNTSLQVFLSSQIFSVTKWTAMVKSIPLIR